MPSSTRARLSKPILMTDDVERRRRRAVYRACHRGTKEMDWILGRFRAATNVISDMTVATLLDRLEPGRIPPEEAVTAPTALP